MRVIAPSGKPTRLATLGGGIRQLKPGEPYDLDGEFLRLALAAGAEPHAAPGTETAPVAPAPETPPENHDVDRAERIREAIDELIERGDDNAFTTAGVPRVREVNALLVDGEEAGKDEIEAVFASMKGG